MGRPRRGRPGGGGSATGRPPRRAAFPGRGARGQRSGTGATAASPPWLGLAAVAPTGALVVVVVVVVAPGVVGINTRFYLACLPKLFSSSFLPCDAIAGLDFVEANSRSASRKSTTNQRSVRVLASAVYPG